MQKRGSNPWKMLEDAILAQISNSHICEKLNDLENRMRLNNLHIVGLPESFSTTQLIDPHARTIPEQLGLRIPCIVERAHIIGQ